MSGGNLGAGYSVGPEVLVKGMPYLVNDGSLGNCQAVAPGYALTGVTPTGLPGMSGTGPLPGYAGPTLAMKGGGGGQAVPLAPSVIKGSRSRRNRRGSRRMRGGRYEVSPAPIAGGDSPNVAASFNRIACENGAAVPGGPSHVSPTPPTQPGYASLPGAVPGVNPVTNYVYGSASAVKMAGGALTPPYSGGTPLEQPTAGYTHLRTGADAVVTQAGVPVMFNVPSDGRAGMSSACVKTGGRRKNRKSRKNRKNRKNRK